MDGLTLGSNFRNDSFSDIDVGKILIYPEDKTGIESDVEDYLNDKWSVY